MFPALGIAVYSDTISFQCNTFPALTTTTLEPRGNIGKHLDPLRTGFRWRTYLVWPRGLKQLHHSKPFLGAHSLPTHQASISSYFFLDIRSLCLAAPLRCLLPSTIFSYCLAPPSLSLPSPPFYPTGSGVRRHGLPDGIPPFWGLFHRTTNRGRAPEDFEISTTPEGL